MTNLNTNLNRMERYHRQIESGRKFDRPSEDPVGMSKSLKLYTDLSKIEQYQRNLNDSISWMHTTEDAISEVGEIIQRARELIVYASNGDKTEGDTRNIAEEIKQLKDQLVKLGNTRHAGRSIFTGFKTDKDLLKVDDDGKVTYAINVSKGDVSIYNVGISENIEVNTIGSKIFGALNANGDPAYGESVNEGDEIAMMDIFDRLISAMGTSSGEENADFDQDKINGILGDIDKIFDQVLAVRSEIGAKTNRLEMTEKRLSSENINFRNALSLNEDVDAAEAIMELKMAENVYMAAMSMGSRVIQSSLIDFLR